MLNRTGFREGCLVAMQLIVVLGDGLMKIGHCKYASAIAVGYGTENSSISAVTQQTKSDPGW